MMLKYGLSFMLKSCNKIGKLRLDQMSIWKLNRGLVVLRVKFMVNR
jgi:hypothetical protein